MAQTKGKDLSNDAKNNPKGRKKAQKIFWYTVFLLGILVIFAIHYLPAQYPVALNEVASDDIIAPQTITFVDEVKTAELKKDAADKIGEVYVIDDDAVSNMEEQISVYYDQLWSLATRTDLGHSTKVDLMKNSHGLSDLTASIFLSLEQNTVNVLKSESINLLRDNWREGVKDYEVEDKRNKILAQVELLNYNAPFRDIIKATFQQLELQPNLYLDEEATLRAKTEASNAVEPVLVTVREGQVIVRKGEVVTQEQMDIIKALGYKRSDRPGLTLAGIAIFISLCVVLSVLYMKLNHRELYQRENSLALLVLLTFVTLFVAKLIVSINISAKEEIAELVVYLVPVAMGSILIAILLDTKIAIFMTMILSLWVGLLADNQLSAVLVAFVGGTVGVYSISRFSQRLDWVRAGLIIAGANAVCIAALGIMSGRHWQIILTGVFLGILNGFFSTILAYGSVPFLESGFKVTTSVRLLELSNPSQPLLRRLQMEAPGTYHHSIMVGNLSEAAAEAVGADSLLVRVGSYYHDIGKLKRPYFFIENQLGGENPHEKLTPALSTLIITSHPKDGVELAKQYGLPQVIIDLILQHHGTGLATYFYHKAVEQGNADNVNEDDFRYNAVKPQTKEAAIIMLADSVEAAVRAMDSSNPGKIESVVRKIINERLQDGQLEESDLTFKDLDKITNAFCHILAGVYHSRIEYPENVIQAMGGGVKSDEDPNSEQPEQDNGK